MDHQNNIIITYACQVHQLAHRNATALCEALQWETLGIGGPLRSPKAIINIDE
jgi:hypothetical protein